MNSGRIHYFYFDMYYICGAAVGERNGIVEIENAKIFSIDNNLIKEIKTAEHNNKMYIRKDTVRFYYYAD